MFLAAVAGVGCGAGSDGSGADHPMDAGADLPPAKATCRAARPVGRELVVQGGSLAEAIEPAPACNGGPSRPAIHYRATVPSGHRLSARAISNPRSPGWTPVLQLLSTCGAAATCLAGDHLGQDGLVILRHVNHGPRDQEVVLAVAASAQSHDARYDLVVDIAPPLLNQTCQSAAPLHHGLALPAQDLAEGGGDPGGRCRPGHDRSLFYRATLHERQTLRLTLNRRSQRPFGVPPLAMFVRDSCDPADCGRSVIDREVFNLTHVGPGPRHYVFELTDGGRQGSGTLFDLSVQMSPVRTGEVATPLRLQPGALPLE